MRKITWPLNVLEWSSAYGVCFPPGSHLRNCIEIAFSVINKKYEIDTELLADAEKKANEREIFIISKTLREYARAHALAVKFLGSEHEVLAQKFFEAREKGKITTALRGIECLVKGGITDWTDLFRAVVEESIRRIERAQREGIKRTSRKRKEEKEELEVAKQSLLEIEDRLNVCQKERDDLAKIRDDLQQVLSAFLKKFSGDTFKELAELLEFFPLVGIMPEAEADFRRSVEQLRRLETRVVKPSALLFNFPEHAQSGRKIKYDPEFLLEVAKRFSSSRKGMTSLREALSGFALDLDVKKPRPPKSKPHFAVPEDCEVYAFPVGERWFALYLLRKSRERLPVVIRYLEPAK